MKGLNASGIVVGYGGPPVIDGLDFHAPQGKFTAILGPNGCGKSTLVKALSRVLPVQGGEVSLDGMPLSSFRPRKLAQRIALLPQHPIVPAGVSVRQLVSRGRYPYHTPFRQWSDDDAPAIDAALEATGITEIQDADVESLSGGQRQRAWLAMVLAQQTQYVLLDEPTSFLDIAHQIDVLRLCRDIAAAGRTVLAVLHDLNQAARYADELVVMQTGRIVAQGTPDQVLNATLVKDVFELDTMISADPWAGSPMVIPTGS